jgi:hypothetical protein
MLLTPLSSYLHMLLRRTPPDSVFARGRFSITPNDCRRSYLDTTFRRFD